MSTSADGAYIVVHSAEAYKLCKHTGFYQDEKSPGRPFCLGQTDRPNASEYLTIRLPSPVGVPWSSVAEPVAVVHETARCIPLCR